MVNPLYARIYGFVVMLLSLNSTNGNKRESSSAAVL